MHKELLGSADVLTNEAGAVGHLAGQRHPVTGVPFDAEGFPDFRAAGVVKVEVQIEYTGNPTSDYRAVDKAAGFDRRPDNMTWHHHQDGRTMQLVPHEIHYQTGHTGGYSLHRKLHRK